jgi:hypothetical protein
MLGWRFLGWYTGPDGGVRIIDEYGQFLKNAGDGAYTTNTGAWCYFDDMTLYALWEPQIYTISLNAMMSGVGDADATKDVYEKYDTNWYLDEYAVTPAVTAITPPVWPGYTFGGYYTEANGAGTQIIDENGIILANHHTFLEHTMLLAKWDPTPYRVEVRMNLDDAAYTGQDVALYQYGALRYTLNESPPGVYTYDVPLGSPAPGVVGGTYDLYVGGEDTGRTVTVDLAPNTTTHLDYYTANVTTTLDSMPTEAIGAVTLHRDGDVVARLVYSGDVYTAPVLFDGAQNANNTCEVYVGGEDAGVTLNMADVTKRDVTIPYYTATVKLVYDTVWNDAAVTLRRDGTVKHYLSFVSSTTLGDGDEENIYAKIIRGDLGTDADLYKVFVNGADTFTSLQADADGLSQSNTTAVAEYYAASVDVQRDNASWTDTSAELWQDNIRAYTLVYNSGSHTYAYPYVLKRTDIADELNVRVYGSISGTNTSAVLSETSPSAALTYWSVNYSDRGTVSLRQVVADGEVASEPADPYHVGYTFLGWRTDISDENTAYNFGNAVINTVYLYAAYDAPEVRISGYIKCNIGGTVDGAGGYYRMVNLSINGYPRVNMPMNAAILHITNAADATDGYEVYDNTDAAGDGSVTVRFNTGGGGISMAAAQKFLRENVIVTVKDVGAEHTMQVYVYGSTL